jgi:hypothetical protein
MLLLLGSECDGSGSTGTGGIWPNPRVATVPVGGTLTLDVIVNSTSPAVQAYDIDVQADPPILLPYAIVPDAMFDDDGKLFRDPTFYPAQALAAGITDLRHGTAASGTFRIATLTLVAAEAGTTTVTISGPGVAGADGQIIPLVILDGTVTITDP